MATIDSYFQYLVEVKGSDLHLSEGSPPKVRVHGSVSAIPDQPILEGDEFRALLGEISLVAWVLGRACILVFVVGQTAACGPIS